MVKLILITHGNLGEALLETASTICCCEGQPITAFSVSGKVNLEELEESVKNSLSTEGTVILVDSFGGTSSNIALKCAFGNKDISVICGNGYE